MQKTSTHFPILLTALVFTLLVGTSATAALTQTPTPLMPAGTGSLPSPAPATAPTAAALEEETPTEGGFVFYNRKLIAQTMGKTRQLLLTFDDGPSPTTTPIVLDTLKRWNLKGIFFLTGMNVRKYPSLVKRIYDEGHTIGNHTFYHLDLRKFAATRVREEIRTTNDLIARITGVRPRLFRPPYGALNATVIEILRQEGMDIMLWTFDPRDWRNRSMAQTVSNLKKQIHLEGGGKGGIILLHDTLPSTGAALEPLLSALAQHALMPSPYQRDQPHGRGFWAARGPSLQRAFHRRRPFRPDPARCPLLTSLISPPAPTDLSAVTLLRAKKSGNLFTALLSRAF